MRREFYDVIVIGGGPAGLAAALAADRCGAKMSQKTLLVEREAKLGGILKQCIHDGFGLVRFNEKLSGPEYAHRFIQALPDSGVEISEQTFVSKIEKADFGYTLILVNRDGVCKVSCISLVLATGCRERSSRQIGIHGRHAAGVYTAGTAQYYVNILGKMPTRRCVILGSGDIGLIMARRLTLEGAEVLGVYEAKPEASGLTRNVYQCLEDFDIPLHTNKTVTRLFGEGRLNAVEISSVDNNMEPISGTEEIIECDALILSVGLIPENELAESLGIPLDERTKGPISDQNCMTMLNGVFCCGNALHVNDLVDFVSESGECAGREAALYASGQMELKRQDAVSPIVKGRPPTLPAERFFAELAPNEKILYIVPQKLDINKLEKPIAVYFRSKNEMQRSILSVCLDGKEIYTKTYQRLRPPEMERLELNLTGMDIKCGSKISFNLSGAE